MGQLSNAGVFLIQTLFGLYLIAIMLRLLLQVVRADFSNPFAKFLVTITNPALKPLRRVIPGVGGIDLSSVVLMLLLKMLEIFLISLITELPLPQPVGLVVLSIFQVIELMVNVFLWSIIIQAIISWINPSAYNPVVSLLRQLTDPLLAPARQLIPPVSGVDLSPLAVIILIYLLKLIFIDLLVNMGKSMAFPAAAAIMGM